MCTVTSLARMLPSRSGRAALSTFAITREPCANPGVAGATAASSAAIRRARITALVAVGGAPARGTPSCGVPHGATSRTSLRAAWGRCGGSRCGIHRRSATNRHHVATPLGAYADGSRYKVENRIERVADAQRNTPPQRCDRRIFDAHLNVEPALQLPRDIAQRRVLENEFTARPTEKPFDVLLALHYCRSCRRHFRHITRLQHGAVSRPS